MYEPHWERSPRRHGYWDGDELVGYIGLTMPGDKLEYHWRATVNKATGGQVSGVAVSLRAAKLLVEWAYLSCSH